MTVKVIFKSNGNRTPKPVSFEGHIVYCDKESVTTENSYNGARQYWNYEKDNVAWIECQ